MLLECDVCLDSFIGQYEGTGHVCHVLATQKEIAIIQYIEQFIIQVLKQIQSKRIISSSQSESWKEPLME